MELPWTLIWKITIQRLYGKHPISAALTSNTTLHRTICSIFREFGQLSMMKISKRSISSGSAIDIDLLKGLYGCEFSRLITY